MDEETKRMIQWYASEGGSTQVREYMRLYRYQDLVRKALRGE